MAPLISGVTLKRGAAAVAAAYFRGSNVAGGGASPLPTGYNIIVAAGQSNMQGAATYITADQTADTLGPAGTQLVKYFGTARGLGGYGNIVSGVSPITIPTGGASSGLSPSEIFARSYAAATGKKVLLVTVPVANTGLAVAAGPWLYTAAPANPPGTSGNTVTMGQSNLYANMIYEANRAIAAAVAAEPGSAIVGLLWGQGENDGASTNEPDRKTALNNLIDGFRAQVTGASNAWVILGGMLPEAIYDEPLNYGVYQNFRRINQADKKLSFTKPRVAFARGSYGYADRAVDMGGSQLGAIHYRLRDGVVDLGQRMYSVLSDAVARTTGASTSVPDAPTIRTITATSGQSLRMNLYREWSQGNTDLVIQYKPSASGTWLDYYTGLNGTFQTAEFVWIGGLTASTQYDVRIADKNSVGQSAWSATATATTQAGGNANYDFEADTLAAAPAGVTTFCNRVVVSDGAAITVTGGQPAFGKCLNPTGAGGTTWDAWLDKIPVGRDRTIVFRLGKSNATNSGVLDVIMRAQPDTPGVGASYGVFQGYRVTINYGSVQLGGDLLDDDAATVMHTASYFGAKTDQYYRVSMIGTTFKLEYSGDKTTWTAFFTVTDATDQFKTGGVQLIVRNSGLPTNLFIDSIEWS